MVVDMEDLVFLRHLVGLVVVIISGVGAADTEECGKSLASPAAFTASGDNQLSAQRLAVTAL